ncbi:MAG: PhoX family phosphatase [Okeania sp. SIO3I5]|uniref:PhoX family protein n=1 Tax=Okeania sp. SIO3I5 TaxID=2607805 RepID=UPI0013BBBD43|nr:PhoX family phosphatase [Okeania sp. SIO3I5]NEQ36217.1 PhoX family phosphatase [Okeania sp. SIO3I5]
MSRLTRRKLLMFFGCSAAATALSPKIGNFLGSSEVAQAQTGGLSFTPLKLAHPLEAYENSPSFVPLGIGGGGNTIGAGVDVQLQSYEYFDDVIVPPEYERYVIVGWGDRVFPNQEEYFGYNNDYLSFIPINGNPDDGYLWANHEYVSYPISSLLGGDDLAGFPTTDQLVLGLDLSQPTLFTLGEFAYNQGGSIVRITKSNGRYTPVADDANRRVHLLSGLGINSERSDGYQSVTSWGTASYQTGDQNFLIGTGPAATEVFPLSSDGLGNRIIGTAFNCSGGTTPWGTILTAEENFQGSVTEAVQPNGIQTGYDEEGIGFTFGLVGEKYGWMVEISPADPSFVNRKHTALGRFRHENIAFRIEAGRPLVAYMGDDRRGGHTYKFISNGIVSSPTDPNNSQLFEAGTLYVARLNRDGSGQWIPLVPSTPTNPLSPREIAEAELNAFGEAQRDGRIRLPQRAGIAGATEDGGSLIVDLTNDNVLSDYQGRTLGDFYSSQGAILSDAFLASNLIGGTPSSRPEDVEVHPGDGSLFIAYTDNAPGGDGYPDSRIFVVSKYSADINAIQQFGGLYRFIETNSDATSTTFSWSVFEHSGEDGAINGAGFANVDNLEIDTLGNIWGVTDMSTSNHNGFRTGAAAELREIDHTATGNISSLTGVFGNNWLFYIPVVGPNAGLVVPFAYGPPRCEMTGPYFIRNRSGVDETLLLAVQHPGESSPIGDGVILGRTIEMLSLDGTSLFNQARSVPRGSSWPSNIGYVGNPGGSFNGLLPPRPSVIGVTRRDGGAFV